MTSKSSIRPSGICPGICHLLLCLAVAGLLITLQFIAASPVLAQDEPAAADAEAEEALGNVPDTTPDEGEGADNQRNAKTSGNEEDGPNLLQLLLDGGWPMIPIFLMLILVITFVIERSLGLRRSKVLPEQLTREFGRLATGSGGFDPRKAYRACQQYPCAASNVIRAMLLKIGRPHAEVEHAVIEANEREAAQLYANVRWLNLAAAVTPLMGLFGTVWGMINAFYATANLPEGASKAEVLADGIVIALVTTLGGLFVAIPAAIAAHFFEGRIQMLFREIGELLFSLLPQVERYEGKLRVSREQLSAAAGGEAAASAEPVVAQSVGNRSKQQHRTAAAGTAERQPQGTQQPAEASK